MRKVLAGLVLGLVMAEGAFWLRDGGAFAHLNIYESDPELGARLQRDATTRIAFGGNPATEVHTNARGYRMPNPTAKILAVGDSQVFGLGVADDETFSAKLGAFNGGVPTYGPTEYTEVIRRIAPAIEAKTVVYVVNLANDLFEMERPNARRHAVWDGWAVRAETAPSSVTAFPGRHWLMSRSHLVYALRRLLHSSSEDAGFASEGTWKDVGTAASSAPASVPTASESARKKLDERNALARSLGGINGQIAYQFSSHAYREPEYGAVAKQLAHYDGDARDIVANPFAEAARPINSTVNQLLNAALGMERNTPVLRKLAEERGNKELLKLLDQRQKLRTDLAALNAADPAAAIDSPLAAALHKAQQTAAEAGASLLVVALPLDVQVAPAEWKKYGLEPRDLGPTDVLASWVTATAERLGAQAINALPVLRAAEPGAFLNGDLHMSAKGHAALAAAIAAKLQEAPRPRELALPAGRSWLPTQDEWAAEVEVTVKGSTAAHCETKLVREWFRARCFGPTASRQHPALEPDAELEQGLAPRVELQQGGHGDAYASVSNHESTFVTPLLPGDEVVARFYWAEHAQTLRLKLSADGKHDFAFEAKEAVKPPAAPVQPPRIAAIGVHDDACRGARKPPPSCALDVPTRDPKCERNEVAFGVLRRCVPDCSNATSCKNARCVEWQGRFGCVAP